ncbi:MAG: YidC/Oxa1 family insertase periplasmic-domain containing protein [Phycisphaeraceae bacterium]|nr:YidC/Oxa1 family insertase periplasmic-domain containing protein [Phycisphaeraceae bacterium]
MKLTGLIVAIVIGAVFAFAIFYTSGRPGTPNSPTAATTQPASQPSAPSAAPAIQQAGTTPKLPAISADGFHPLDMGASTSVTLGSDADKGPYRLKIDLTYWGAGIKRITLANYAKVARGKERYVLADMISVAGDVRYPFGARRITINEHTIDLYAAAWSLVKADASTAIYRLVIGSSADKKVLEVTRTYSLAQGSYDLTMRQEFRNLLETDNKTDQSLRVVWEQNAQGDATPDDIFHGDDRSYAAGYFKLDYDPQRHHIYTDKSMLPRTSVLDYYRDKSRVFWPNPDLNPKCELAWVASLNRYFALVVHPTPLKSPPGNAADFPRWFEPGIEKGNLDSLGLEIIGQWNKDPLLDQRRAMFTLVSQPFDLAPGATLVLENGLFAGPRESDLFSKQPYVSLDFQNLIVYVMGCTWFTSQHIARWLLWLLKIFHFITFDWGVAIIVLVMMVRLILHPITKRAQINMTRLGKQMSTLKPEIERIKKKYSGDQQAINRETMTLYREKGVNPANMLGCAPMFLQTPIWAALYAMLYGAIELRQQPAFYGIFQKITGGRWEFLGDLARADNFILLPAGAQFTIPLIGIHVTAINLLPFLLAVVFYFQQKLMSPPPADDQAAQQQKIMKYMTLLFPIMLYSSPSGLTLYILASTGAGIVDSVIVKRHIKREEEEGRLFTAKPTKGPKPGGWKDRLMKVAETRQRAMMERQNKRKR